MKKVYHYIFAIIQPSKHMERPTPTTMPELVPGYWDGHMPEDSHTNHPDVVYELAPGFPHFKDNMKEVCLAINAVKEEIARAAGTGFLTVESANESGDILRLENYPVGTVIDLQKEVLFPHGTPSYRTLHQYGVVMQAHTEKNGRWNYMDFYVPGDNSIYGMHQIGSLKPVEIGKVIHARTNDQFMERHRLERIVRADVLSIGKPKSVGKTDSQTINLSSQNPFSKVTQLFKRK